MSDKRVFKAQEVDNSKDGWVADLSPAEYVSQDFYYYFGTQRQAQRFVALVDGGMRPEEAVYTVTEMSKAASAMRAVPSAKRSKASAENGKKGGRPRKQK